MSKRHRRKVHQQAAPSTLAPDTTQPQPGQSGGQFLSVPRKTAGVRVDENVALTCGAVWACVRVISEDIAGLPWGVLEQLRAGGSQPVPEDPAHWLISTQANPETGAFQWREVTLAHTLTWGNGYSEIERDGAGRPLWLWQITPDRVRVVRDSRGRIVYDVMNPGAPNTALEMEDVLHTKGLGFDGLVGYDVIRFHARAIGACIAAEDYSSDLYANDATPGGLLQTDKRLHPDTLKNLRESWIKRHGSAGNKRTLGILEDGLKWAQTSLPPEVMQLIETRQFTPAEICRIFRVSPVKIADYLRATFSNVYELGVWHVTDTLLPWIRRLESEANIKLFGRTNRGKRFTKLNVKGLLRGSVEAQTAHLVSMLERGVYDINEAREFLDLNPIGPDGDKRFVQLNMQLLENAGEEPEPPPVPPPVPPPPPVIEPPEDEEPDEEEDEEAEAEEEDKWELAWRKVFADAMGRILKREQHNQDEAATKFRGLGPEQDWMKKKVDSHAGFIIEYLAPLAEAYALAAGLGLTTGTVQQFAKQRAFECLPVRLRHNIGEASTAEQLADAFLSSLKTIQNGELLEVH